LTAKSSKSDDKKFENLEIENIENILHLSESSLSKDWMKISEDETWADL
jgi:hypothetical protein